MIFYSVFTKSNHWPRRVSRVNVIIKKILNYKRELKFTPKKNYYCNIILANDKFIKKLNCKYKKNNKTTDVLTFVSKIYNKNNTEEKYCDIIFSIDTIKRDIRKYNIDFYDHLTHLIIHSFLHINDFMHNKIKEYLIMKNIEIKILKKMKIENPYY
tara:strand:- start:8957 stop:9424 length:468 start_codon:yes stop_codon:yes gene_type:complete